MMKHINLRLPGQIMSFSSRAISIFYAILCIHIATVLAFVIYAVRFNTVAPTASNSTTPAPGRIASDSLLGEAVDASIMGDWDAVSLYIARYLALSFNGYLEFDGEALSECLYCIGLQPTAFISGKYSRQFIDWFVMEPTHFWLAEPLDMENGVFLLAASHEDRKFAGVLGRPFLESYAIIGMADYAFAPIPMIIDGRVIVGSIEGNVLSNAKEVELPSDGLPVQYIWPPEFHDLDGDGEDEIWIRFNREAGDGFMQYLAVYNEHPDHLSLVTNFIGSAEGIARRLSNGHVQVGYGCGADGQGEGHLGYSQFTLENLEYRDGAFVRISGRRIPHILWSDAWMDFYELPEAQKMKYSPHRESMQMRLINIRIEPSKDNERHQEHDNSGAISL